MIKYEKNKEFSNHLTKFLEKSNENINERAEMIIKYISKMIQNINEEPETALMSFKNIASMLAYAKSCKEIDIFLCNNNILNFLYSFIEINDNEIKCIIWVILEEIIYLSENALNLLIQQNFLSKLNDILNVLTEGNTDYDLFFINVLLGIVLKVIELNLINQSNEINDIPSIFDKILQLSFNLSDQQIQNIEVINLILEILEYFTIKNEPIIIKCFLMNIMKHILFYAENPIFSKHCFLILSNLVEKGFYNDINALNYSTKNIFIWSVECLNDTKYSESYPSIINLFINILDVDQSFLSYIPIDRIHSLLLEADDKTVFLLLYDKISSIGELKLLLSKNGSNLLFVLLDDSNFNDRSLIYHLLWNGLLCTSNLSDQFAIIQSDIFVAMSYFTDFEDDCLKQSFSLFSFLISSFGDSFHHQEKECIMKFTEQCTQNEDEELSTLATNFMEAYSSFLEN